MNLFVCGTRVLTYIIVTEDLCTSEVLCISPCVLCDYVYLANSLLNHHVLSLFSFNFFFAMKSKMSKMNYFSFLLMSAGIYVYNSGYPLTIHFCMHLT